jgi:hypothetical protein
LTGTAANYIQSNIPFLSKNLPARIDETGTPMKRSGKVSTDPTNQELHRLDAINGKELLPAARPYDLRTVNSQATYQDADKYQEKAGQATMAALKQRMSEPDWKGLTDTQKIAEVRRLGKFYRAEARKDIQNSQPAYKDGW